ncbi:CPBP family intramembrane metalloprotease [Persicimonas caeni]|uniref:CPBP family intramembrane metalloprotease n=1 Tax=Persicimonas caeni TaxID=2292766 RepID=A0A4Y6PMB2_PERCE|nr:CPBP family intramembrane glutamic endopeptidase [Persicimonas caeni]QDG49390.1 CPBP family intramembrane metalloprotease [Persicimonas caeni]QED30611.1 CPBP family intramembrane metalloprotease [Persicimonas caeni]
MSTKIQQGKQPAPWLYLFGTMGWTYLFLGVVAFSGEGMYSFPLGLLTLLGGLGPAVVATLLVATGRWDERLDRSARAYWRRCFDPRSLSAGGYLWVFGLVLVLAGGPLIFDPEALGGGVFSPGPLVFLLVGFVFGALEEVGWRGYAQEALQRRMPVVWASLVIGVFWALWHVPLFFLTGSYQSELGLVTPEGAVFFAALVVGSPVYAWLYNKTGRAVLAVILYHGVGNVARELVPDVANWAEFGVEAALALAVVAVGWGVMSRRQDAQPPSCTRRP